MLKERLLNRIWFARVGLVKSIEAYFYPGEYLVEFVHPVIVQQIDALNAVGLKTRRQDNTLHRLVITLPRAWVAPEAKPRTEQAIMEAAMELIANLPTTLTPELYRRDQYGKKQRDGECSVFYDLGQVRMRVEHITQDDEDGVYFAHLKGLDTPLKLDDDDKLIVEWHTLQYEACDYVPEPRISGTRVYVTGFCQYCESQYEDEFSLIYYALTNGHVFNLTHKTSTCPVCWRILSGGLNRDLNKAFKGQLQSYYAPTLEEEVEQQYSRVFEAGTALSPFDQVRIMANEIESLQKERNAFLKRFNWEPDQAADKTDDLMSDLAFEGRNARLMHDALITHAKRVFAPEIVAEYEEDGEFPRVHHLAELMATEIESLREKHNHLALELASMEQSFKGASKLAADNMRERDEARTQLAEAHWQLRANEQYASEAAAYLDEMDRAFNLYLPGTANLPLSNLRKFRALLDLMAAQRAALEIASTELQRARRWAATWKKLAKDYRKSYTSVHTELKRIKTNALNVLSANFAAVPEFIRQLTDTNGADHD